MEWTGVLILIIDEIAFMTKYELTKLVVGLHQCRDHNKLFGGYCIVFGGDFRQLIRDNEFMHSRSSHQFFESILTGIVILDNEHQFKNDPEFGNLLKQFWQGNQKDRNTINKGVVTRTDIDLLKTSTPMLTGTMSAQQTKNTMLYVQGCLKHMLCKLIHQWKAIQYLQIILLLWRVISGHPGRTSHLC
jgi:hypothetical protein